MAARLIRRPIVPAASPAVSAAVATPAPPPAYTLDYFVEDLFAIDGEMRKQGHNVIQLLAAFAQHQYGIAVALPQMEEVEEIDPPDAAINDGLNPNYASD